MSNRLRSPRRLRHAAAPVFAAFLDDKPEKEGWGIRIEVVSEARYNQALVLVRALAALRKDQPRVEDV